MIFTTNSNLWLLTRRSFNGDFTVEVPLGVFDSYSEAEVYFLEEDKKGYFPPFSERRIEQVRKWRKV